MIKLTVDDLNRMLTLASTFQSINFSHEVDLEVGPPDLRHSICISKDGASIDPDAGLDPLPDEVPDDPAGP